MSQIGDNATSTAPVVNWQARAEAAEKELERVRKACAEMQDAIADRDAAYVRREDGVIADIRLLEKLERIIKEIGTNSDYHHRDEFKPLVEALEALISESDYAAHDKGCKFVNVWWKAKTVLNDARAKGLID